MQDREKKLAIGLGGILVVAFALPLFESWFLQPVTDAKNLLATAVESVEKLHSSEKELKLARRNLSEWYYESLPPDPFTAQREYQEWLMDVARMSGFEDPEPTLQNISPARGGTFVEIPVTIEARASLEQLARFLYHVERISLLHRIQTLDVTSPASIGNPRLEVSIQMRGLSLVDAPRKSRLFPTTTLVADVTADTETLAIEAAKGFPLVDGFQIKIDEELLVVRQRGESSLTVERGAEGTTAVAHAAGSLVELFPIDPEVFQSEQTFEQYRTLLTNSPFTKPAPPVDYDPELSPNSRQIVTRGEPWSLKLSLGGWDPAGGDPVFVLGDNAPPDLNLDESTGELSWDPAAEAAVGDYPVEVIARSSLLVGQQVATTIPITLREPNLPPVITPPESLSAFSGRPMAVAITADDPDGDNEAMKFALSGEVPTGARISDKGELQWTPPLTLELGDYELEIAVTDGGEPAKTTTLKVPVTLEDDAALFTRLVGVFDDGQAPEAMLNNLTSGETTRLTQGAEVNAADVSGQIVAIEPNHIVLKVGDETFRLDMGKNLRQMIPLTTAAPATPEVDDTSS